MSSGSPTALPAWRNSISPRGDVALGTSLTLISTRVPSGNLSSSSNTITPLTTVPSSDIHTSLSGVGTFPPILSAGWREENGMDGQRPVQSGFWWPASRFPSSASSPTITPSAVSFFPRFSLYEQTSERQQSGQH